MAEQEGFVPLELNFCALTLADNPPDVPVEGHLIAKEAPVYKGKVCVS